MKYLLMIIVTCQSLFLRGQTFAEWFNQKETQIQYLLDQIAANKVYLERIGKGYEVAKVGLNAIHYTKLGDFKLHHDFISSLTTVSPAIKGYSKVADIISFHVRILKMSGVAIKAVRESKLFNEDEIAFCKGTFDNIKLECSKNLDDLILVIASAQLQMTDDERIRMIDELFLAMKATYIDCRTLSMECSMLAAQRAREQSEIKISKRLNESE